MVVFFAVSGLLVFWVVVIALVKFERGDVGVSPALAARIRLRVALLRATWAIGDVLLPAFRTLADGLVKANEALRPLNEALRNLPEEPR